MKERGVSVSCWIDRECGVRFESIAKKLKMTRSQLAKNLIMSGLDDAEVLDGLGLLTLARMMEETKNRIRLIKEEARKMAQAES